MIDFSQIMTVLPTLSKRQLTQIRQRCLLLTQTGSSPMEEPVEDEDWLLLGIMTELRLRGLENRHTFTIKRTGSYAGFDSQSVRIRELLLSCCGGEMTAIQRRALGEVAARALARYITWTDVTRDALLTYVSRVPEAIEASYPGYAAAGLLRILIE